MTSPRKRYMQTMLHSLCWHGKDFDVSENWQIQIYDWLNVCKYKNFISAQVTYKNRFDDNLPNSDLVFSRQ